MAVPTCFKEEGESVVFTGKYMEIYIPELLFEKNMSEFIGKSVRTIGVFNFRVYGSEDKSGNPPIQAYRFASRIMTKPSGFHYANLPELTNQSDVGDDSDSKYVVLEYFNGDLFIESISAIKADENVSDIVQLIHAGKIPRNLGYDEILGLELSTMKFNGASLRVTATVLEAIISEICRDNKDIRRPFRYRAGSDAKVGMDEYIPINIKNLPNINSTFTSLSFENINYSLTTSINSNKYNRKELESPIEQTIKY